jgi:hypothetical protein
VEKANPRGVSERSDVEADAEGDSVFVTDKEPGTHRATHLEDETAHDPRLHPEDSDEPTEVDLSETAMADEVSEAAGPHPEQAFPTQEGTDPEPTADEAPERVSEGPNASDGGPGEKENGDDPSTSEDEPADPSAR